MISMSYEESNKSIAQDAFESPTVMLTERACVHLKSLEKKRKESLGLRLLITGGGCAGFKYHFDICHQPQKQDYIMFYGSIFLALEPTALPLIKGSKIDYVEEMSGSSFRVENPQAKAGCGCGMSFDL